MLKELKICPIDAKIANEFIKIYHYSKKYVPNSQIHFGIFHKNLLHGVIQFGPSMDKRRMAKNLGLDINSFLEINRMAFDNYLPKNSESRCLSIAMKIIKKNFKKVKYILTFADATQCGDGTIYRAVNFNLLGIKKNNSQLKLTKKAIEIVRQFIDLKTDIIAQKSLDDHMHNGKYLSYYAKKYGSKPVKGFQIKYIYALYGDYDRFHTIPYSRIKEKKACMYKGMRVEHESNALTYHVKESGAIPTDTLQKKMKKRLKNQKKNVRIVVKSSNKMGGKWGNGKNAK